MKKRIKVIVAVVFIFVVTTVSLCVFIPKFQKVNETKKQEEAYIYFCNEQKEKLDKYLEENPHLSLLSYTFGTDKKEAIKLAAACYNKNTNQAYNCINIRDYNKI